MSLDSKSNYYDVGGIEVSKIQRAKTTYEQYEGYLLNNIIKYSLRLEHKGCKQRDIEKLATYSKMLSELQDDDGSEQEVRGAMGTL